jgi:hypothetical protein
VNANYDKYPKVKITGFDQQCWAGWPAITGQIAAEIHRLQQNKTVLALETYPGVHDDEIIKNIREGLQPQAFFDAKEAYLSHTAIDALTFPDVTDDRIFGFMTRLRIEQFFDPQKLKALQNKVQQADGLVVVYGAGATLVAQTWNLLVYADLARWEIQQRMRRKKVSNLGVHNPELEFSRMYKRAYFVDWRVADRLKRENFENWDFVLDTNIEGQPKMATGTGLRAALQETASQPFRVVPFFDPGPWGGQWMKEVCDLDRSAVNYAWCFDCVPEENSLLLDF